MSSSSSLTRYRPAIATILTLSIGYTLWYSYSAWSAKPSKTLHRSNAVHHRHNPTRSAEDSSRADESTSSQAAAEPDEHDGADTVAEGEADTTRRPRGDGLHLKELLYYIAEEQSRLNGYVHRGVMCNGCYMKPIRGVRWRCANCADYDLCSECEAMGLHSKTHIFYKVKIPAPFLGNPRQAQPVVYPGHPERMSRELPASLSKTLASATSFDKEEVDALYEQFTCLANARWSQDPNGIGYAIDRVAFDTAFIPLTSINAPQPNLLYDRIFAFYDADSDGLIGFEELLRGLSYVQRKIPDEKGRRRLIFNGFDIDNDGYISRRDVLRLFRAYYAIQKDVTHDLVAVQEEEFDMANISNFIGTSQPLSAIFTEPAPPPPEQPNFLPEEKPKNAFGERRADQHAIFEASTDEAAREEIIRSCAKESSQAADGIQSDRGSASPSETSSTNHNSSEMFAEFTLQTRIKRRKFYTDEEEGWHPVRDSSSSSADPSSMPQRTPLGLLRSASIWNPSSRPGGGLVDVPPVVPRNLPQRRVHKGEHEIPVPATDMGKEILYQVIQEGLNELLDPLFKAKEDLAMEVEATAADRSEWRSLVAESVAAMKARKQAKSLQAKSRSNDTNKETLATNHASVTLNDDIPADEELVEVISESEEVVEESASPDGWPILSTSCNDSRARASTIGREHIKRDPTLPQFRPNHDEAQKAELDMSILNAISDSGLDGKTTKGASFQINRITSKPSKSQLKRYAMLDAAEQAIHKAGGPGRLNFAEFDNLMRGEKSRKLAFVDSWFELGSF